jgi:hypothetical protein
MNHNNTFFNIKRNLLSSSQAAFASSLLDGPLVNREGSEYDYSDNDEDKMDLDIDHEDFDQASHFSDEYEKQQMLSFLRLRPFGDQQVGGIYTTDLVREE